MLFEESDLLKALPKQFFAGLVAKVNAKVAEGADVINLGQGNPDQPTYDHIVEALCTSAKILLAISIHSFEAIVLLRKLLLVFTRNIMGSIWMRSVRFVSWEVLKLGLWNCP